MTTRRSPLAFWLLPTSIFGATVLPRLFEDGMFLDGLMYATISRNLAAGLGTWWKPHFSETLYGEFFADHPPLVFWVESIFFRMFGDHYLVEAFYSLCTAVAAGVLIVLLWRRLTANYPELARLAWLPVFFWLSIPQILWIYSNNMLENTLTVFMLLSVMFLVKASFGDRPVMLYIVLGGIFSCAGVLSKGPLALFPIAVVGLYWLIIRRISFARALLYTSLLLVTMGIVAAIVWSIEDARVNLTRYYEIQLLPSVTGERGANSHRLKIVGKLLEELAPMIGISLVVTLVALRKRFAGSISDGPWQLGVFMLAVGASGVLPVAASLRQNTFYIVPAFPFFALGLGLITAPIILRFTQKIGTRAYRAFRATAIVALIAILGFAFSAALRSSSDPTLIDLKAIGEHVNDDAVISICPSMRGEWGLFAVLARYYNVSLDWSGRPLEFAVTKGECQSLDSTLYETVDLNTTVLRLYQLKATPPH